MKFITSLFAVAILFLATYTQAATTVGVLPSTAVAVINSTSTTNQLVNFPAWPVVVAGATSVTNFTTIDITGYNDVALKFVCQTTNTTSTSNVVWTIYRDVPNRFPTNAVGTGVNCAILGTVTNILNGVAPVTAIASYNGVPRTTASTYQSTDAGIAGISTLYIGYVTVPGLSGITNYQVYVSKK